MKDKATSPSGQSACPAAGCQTDADQGWRYAVWMYREGEKGPEQVECISMGLKEPPAVARRPADTAGVLDEVVKWLRDRIRDCESEAWKAAWHGNYERSAIMDVRKKAYQFTAEEIRDIQNQTKKPGLG